MSRQVRSVLTSTLMATTLFAGLALAPIAPRSAIAAGTVVALPGYQTAVFARGTGAYFKPDSVEVVGQHVFVGYQNGGNPDGSNHKPSTVVEYTMRGVVVRTVQVPGHCDGLRLDPYTHMLWATSNEDANSLLTIMDPSAGTAKTYPLGATAHSGGYDDLAFIGGKVFISGSNPTLDSQAVNTRPALYTLRMPNGMPAVQPDVMGNARARDMTTGHMTTINMVDPDSLTVDPAGDVVQDNQGGSALLFVHHPGTARQSLSTLPLATQVDDTVWATSSRGQLLVADASRNTIYSVTAPFTPGTVYTETPNDSSIPSIVGVLDPHTGFISPVIIGLGSPSGLAFAPGM